MIERLSSKLRNFLNYSASQKKILLELAMWCGFVKLAKWTAKANSLHGLGPNSPTDKSSQPLDQDLLNEVEFALAVLNQNWPTQISCLEECKIIKVFFKRRGIDLNIQFGARMVPQTPHQEIHAWIEVKNEVIAGKHQDLSQFTSFR